MARTAAATGGGQRQAGRARQANANVTRQGDRNEHAGESDAFMREFGDCEITDTTRARGDEIAAQVAEETKEDLHETRDQRNRLGDSVGTDGSLLFV